MTLSNLPPTSALPQQHNNMWEVSMHSDMPLEYDQADPANTESPVSLDDQIKAFEAMQAAQSRHTPSRPQEKEQRRRVCFADDALLYSSDRQVEEVKRMWYSREELSEFKNERKQIVKVLKKANFDLAAVEQTGRYCLRGYEPYFSMEVNKAMKYARTLVSNLVMAEQDRQRTSGYLDDEALRQACCGASQWARDNALQLGSNDELEVYGCYDDDEMEVEESEFGLTYEEQMYYSESLPTQNQHLAPAYYSSEAAADESMQNSILGKRKEEVQQPEFTPRVRAPETPAETDPLAERLDCALKLVQALKFGSASSSR